jgi:cation diffusion facilitator family transporter
MASSDASPLRAIIYALAANFGIALGKTWAAAFTGSSSMLAEATHSYADTGNQLLLLLGMHRARRGPDPEHPLGYGKVAYFWSFMVALLLFSMGGLFSIYQGWHKLEETGPLEHAWVAVGVLVVSLVLEGVSMKGCLEEVEKVRQGRSLWRWLNESRRSELVVVFGEDLAALLGLSVALVFVGLAIATGDRSYDAMGSLAIGVLLVVIAVFVAVRVKALLIGRSADPNLVAAIEREIDRDPMILEVFNLITVQVGAQVMLAAKVRMQAGLSLDEAIDHLNRLETHLKARIPDIGWSFMEPDVAD